MDWALTISLIANGALAGLLAAEWKSKDEIHAYSKIILNDLSKAVHLLQTFEMVVDKETMDKVDEVLREEAKNETNRNRKKN